MANLVVTPQYLQTLAATQTQAAATAASAGAASTNLKNEVWVSHGVISGASKTSFANAEAARRAAANSMNTTSSKLAAKLRIASSAYQGVDEQAGESLDKQIIER
ncbi:ESX-1 secretion-associated protein [Mycobacterium liflandii]|nr:hypothetical protein BB170200_03485 [Mycobacterium marinum]ULL09878.1 ESX-1 secretion-associated protein [Mycobacterium liflandii]